MGVHADPSKRSPWQTRDAAMRRLGKIRRVIVLDALEGNLPTEETRAAYNVAAQAFDRAHAAWLRSREAAQAAAAA